MAYIRLLLLTLTILGISGCSTETLKRTGYETLQNVKEQQCQKQSPEDCPERESYDKYKDKIKDSEGKIAP